MADPILSAFGIAPVAPRRTTAQLVLTPTATPQQAYWAQRLANQGSLKAHKPTVSERVEGGLAKSLGAMFGGSYGKHVASRATSALNDATALGGVSMLEQAKKEWRGGDTLGALLNGGGGLLGTVPGLGGASKAMFLGVLAKTADKAALRKAESLAARGASREQIWNDTGWFKGADDKWRFEVDDSGVRLGKFDEVKMKRGVPLGSVLKHPELAAAYPQVASGPLKVRYDLAQLGYGGNYLDGEIALSPSFMNSRSKERTGKVLGHEAQHHIQDIEGFASGGNVQEFEQWPPAVANDALVLKQFINRAGGADYFDDALRAFREAMGRNPDSLAGAVARQYEMGDLQTFTNPKSGYRRLAGEVEARNVERRWGMSPLERQQNPPWLTQDVADEDQIIRFR